MERKYNLGSFNHYLDFFKKNFEIMWKLTVEYKTNFYMNLFEVFILSSIAFFSYFLIGGVFENFISWTLGDYVFFSFLIYICFIFGGFFSWGKRLDWQLLKGDFNIFLTKPLNPFIFYIFLNLSGWALISFFGRIFFIFLTIYLFDIKLYNLGLAFLVFMLISINFLLVFQFLEALSFFGKKLSEIFGGMFYWDIFNINMNYPEIFFRESKLKYVLIFFSSFFVGSLLLPILRNYEIWNFWFQIYFLVIFNLILIILLFIMWKFGLKRYEAFG
jgi:ABC-type uncharacterized transport system permease subunit